MKKIIITLAILISAFLVSSFYVGTQAESKLNELYEKSNQNPSVQIEIVEYNRGIISSDARTKITLSAEAVQQSEDFSFEIIQEIQHGPLLWRSKGFGVGLADSRYEFVIPEEFKAKLDEIKDLPEDALVIVSRLFFDGSSASVFTINPFIINEDNSSVEFLAGEFKTSVSSDNKITATGAWQGLKITENDIAVVEVGELKIDSNQTLISGDLFSPMALVEGDMLFALEKMQINGATPLETVILENLSVSSTTSFSDQDLGKFDIVFEMKKLTAMGQEYSNLIYDMTFENVDKDSIIKLNQLMSESSTDAADPEQSLQRFQALLPSLLDKEPLFKINQLGFSSPYGVLSSSSTIKIDKSLYDNNDIMSLMIATDATANGSAPFELFESFGMGADIDFMVEQNMLTKENGLIKFDLIFKGGEAKLNGNLIPLGM